MNREETLALIDCRPWVLPVAGFVAGLLLWVLDAAIDTYLLGAQDSFIASICCGEFAELWMRTLVLVVMTAMGWVSRTSLKKHAELDRLRMEYQRRLESLVDQRTSELMHKTLQLQKLANRDQLTGLYNRRRMEELLQLEYERFQRVGRPFCVLYVDVDHFKRINDAYGHGVGDQVMIEVAERLRRFSRRTDSCARWGGEEFVVLSPDTALRQAEVLADKLLCGIHAQPVRKVGMVTASIGVAECHRGEPLEQLLKRADEAMYKAKDAGRDRLVLAG